MTGFKVILRIFNRIIYFLLKGSRLPVFFGLVATFFTWWLYTSAPPALTALLERLDNVVYDQRYNLMLKPPATTNFKIIIIDIDQKSLEAEGQWPWSRFKLGDLVTQLSGYGALVVGFDFFFPEYERNIVAELQQRTTDTGLLDLVPRLEEMQELLDGDKYFAEQMQQTDVVLGFSFRPDEVLREGTLPQAIIEIDASLAESIALDQMRGYVGNVDVLQAGAAGAGFFDTRPDLDGVIRRSPLVMQYLNRLYPSLALEMARLYYFEENFSLTTEVSTLGGFRDITGIKMGQVFIPTDTEGRVMVPYAGPSALGTSGVYTYISATDILHGTLAQTEMDALQNSLVLIGSTETGLYDLRATPLEAVYPGVEIHANVLNAILRSSPVSTISRDTVREEGLGGIVASLAASQASPFPSKPYWEEGSVLFGIIVIGMFLSFIYPKLGPALLTLSSLVFMFGMVMANFALWSEY
ncbi:CHASE2 domain-containing protein, partial [Gammaproteobacteria bacterium]|nr:CHASE2 domain-containing protein [Gammaproteobacteria bacterium]